MNKRKLNSSGGIIFSTDPNFKPATDPSPDQETLIPAEQKLKIRLDTKRRAGKAVTLVEGFIGKDTDREELGKKIKTFCGTGGSVKDEEIIIQGDQREKVMQWLLKNGFKNVKRM